MPGSSKPISGISATMAASVTRPVSGAVDMRVNFSASLLWRPAMSWKRPRATMTQLMMKGHSPGCGADGVPRPIATERTSGGDADAEHRQGGGCVGKGAGSRRLLLFPLRGKLFRRQVVRQVSRQLCLLACPQPCGSSAGWRPAPAAGVSFTGITSFR